MNLIIKDKEYELVWGMGCMEMYCDTRGCGIEGLEDVFVPGKEQINALTTLIHCAIKNGADVESVYDDFEVTYRALQKDMDGWSKEKYRAVIEDFKNSRYFGQTMAEHLSLEVANVPTEENPKLKKKSRSVKS